MRGGPGFGRGFQETINDQEEHPPGPDEQLCD